MKKISVIIPVYNGEKYINKCWMSLLKQTSDKWEAIFVNDGSNDNSQNILAEIGEKNKGNCKIYYSDNNGQYIARKLGIQRATGNYCMFLDVDDELEENAIETILAIIEKKLPDIIIFDAKRIKGEKELPFWECFSNSDLDFSVDNKKILLKELLLTKRFNNLCFKAVKKELCLEIIDVKNINNIRVEEDLLMQLSWIDKANYIVYTPNRLYRYNFTPDSVTNSFVPGRYIAAESVNSALLYYAVKWNMEECKEQINERYYIEICESVRQLKYYQHSMLKKILYISKIHNNKYFKKKYDSENVNVNVKRKLLLFCIRWNLWPVIILVI